MQEADDLQTLMPNTIAVAENSNIHSSNLKQYMEVSNNDFSASDINHMKQSEARTIWKDHQGFEDIDEFWIEDDSAVSAADGATEDEDDGDSSLDLNLSVSSDSSTSEREVTVPGEPSTLGFEDEQPEFDFDGASIHDTGDDMEVDNIFVEKKLSTTRSREAISPTSGFERNVSKSTKRKSKKKNRVRKNTFSLSPIIPRDEKDVHEIQQMPAKILKRKSIQNDFLDYPPDGFDVMSSPFIVNDGSLTPLSNTSDRSLKHIPSFDDVHYPSLSKKTSPVGKKKLFDPVKKGKKAKYLYKEEGTTNSELFNDAEMTDQDASFKTVSSATESEGDQSVNEDDLEKSTEIDAREKDLSFAEEVLADGLRRSKRRRYKPLAWYKGEHYVYERTHTGVGLVIPTVVGVARAGVQTPEKVRVKPRKVTTSRATTRKLGRSMAKLSDNKLPDDCVYEHGEWAELYDSMIGMVNKINVICRQNQVEFRTIPNANQNEVDEKRLGYAAQTFNLGCFTPFSRWIAGQLGLPPLAEKDIESGGDKISVFFVMDCQPQSLEVAMAPLLNAGEENDDDDDDDAMDIWDSKRVVRFLLSAGDEFYVPPRNAYYLNNHSESATAELRFMLLKPETAQSRDADVNTTSTQLNNNKIDEIQQETQNEKERSSDHAEPHVDRIDAKDNPVETHVNENHDPYNPVETHGNETNDQDNPVDK